MAMLKSNNKKMGLILENNICSNRIKPYLAAR